LKSKQNQKKRAYKRADLEMLELAAAAGEIHLKYADESGFTLWSEVQYGWSKRGEQKTIEQSKKKGKRLNVCGFLEKEIGFDYGLALKTMTSEEYIKLLNWQAKKAEKRLKKNGKITVIVEDGASIHNSQIVRSQKETWEEQGLYLFQLPAYSPDLNEIENEWQRLKEDEIAGQTFECEYDLVVSLIEAVERRGEARGLEVNRFHFKQQKKSQKKAN
jgi:putative transposase